MNNIRCKYCDSFLRIKNRICAKCRIIKKNLPENLFILLCSNVFLNKFKDEALEMNLTFNDIDIYKTDETLTLSYFEYHLRHIYDNYYTDDYTPPKPIYSKEEYYDIINSSCCYFCNSKKNINLITHMNDYINTERIRTNEYIIVCVNCEYLLLNDANVFNNNQRLIRTDFDFFSCIDYIIVYHNIELIDINNNEFTLEKSSYHEMFSENNINISLYDKFMKICNDFYTCDFYQYFENVIKHVDLNYDEHITNECNNYKKELEKKFIIELDEKINNIDSYKYNFDNIEFIIENKNILLKNKLFIKK